MITFSTRFDPTTAVCTPDLYYIIGKRLGLEPAADNRADEVICTFYGEFALNVLLETSPDGLIIQRGGKCYESQGGRLKPFDPQRHDWTNKTKSRPAHEMDAKEWAKYLEHETRNFEEFILRYRYGNRHTL